MCRHAHSASRKQPVRDMKPAVSRHGKGSSALRNGLYRTTIEPLSHNGRGFSAVPKSLFRSKGKCPELRPSQYHDAGKALSSLHTASSVPLKSTFRTPEKAFLQARTGSSATAERLVCGVEKRIHLTVSHLRKPPETRVFAPYRTPRSKYEALVGLR